MDEKNRCPECDEVLQPDGRCNCCGWSRQDTAKVEKPMERRAPEERSQNRETVKDNDEASVIGKDARVNVAGDIRTTTNRVDNSTQYIQNTTINQIQKAEYCEVCGEPLEEKHPKCPKCGKEICPNCKVKGKNRCVECEKKAVNEYRVAFQQLMLASNGRIDNTGRQMMNQKARDLDVEDVKSSIEKELLEEYAPAAKAVQPDVVVSKGGTTQEKMENVARSLGREDIARETIVVVPSKKGSSKLGVYIILLAIVAGAIWWFSTDGQDTSEPAVASEVHSVQQQTVGNESASAKQQESSVTAVAPTTNASSEASTVKKAVEKPSQPAPAQTDTNYDAGMAAYKAGDGLEAIQHFQASGSAKSNYMLGVIYENGCGSISKNAMKARSFYKTAAKQGSAEAKAKLN